MKYETAPPPMKLYCLKQTKKTTELESSNRARPKYWFTRNMSNIKEQSIDNTRKYLSNPEHGYKEKPPGFTNLSMI